MFQLSICGWSSDKTSLNQKDIFSIYLVKNSNLTYATKKPELKDFVLENTPLLTVDSIASYNWHSHLISFPMSIKKELSKREPLLHFLFVVVANDERIYWGMFTDPADSYFSLSPTISLLLRNHNSSCIPDVYFIARAPIIDQDSVDVRNDIRLYIALKASGKLLP
jgi:hypothetical protein